MSYKKSHRCFAKKGTTSSPLFSELIIFSFNLSRHTGSINTAVPLNRESIPRFELTARVQDAGMPEWECSSRVIVRVEDSNDSPPKWTQGVFSASLKEDAPVGSVATKVHATDADTGENKRLRYSLLDSADGAFKVDPATGLVALAKALDRETRALYNLTVRAMDHGRPRLSSTCHLVVTVLDVNDNPPEFASKYYFATVSEDVVIGTDVVKVFAASKDTGINADITYSLVGGNEHRRFRIDSKTGVVLVNSELDFEKSSGYFLTIQAQDGGDPPLSNHATANITIRDVNDHSPTFTQISYAALVSESSQVGTEVLTLTATDADSGDNGRVSYSVLGGDRHNQFAVDGNGGTIRVAAPLDREMVSSYVLEVQAVDGGAPNSLSSTVLVTIDVSDANDNPPIFPEGNYTAHLQEDRPEGHVVHRFAVTDADDAPNGAPFTFDLRSGNEDGAFLMVQDGSLRTSGSVGFDHKRKPKYVLQVRAYDSGSPSLFSDSYLTVNVIEESKFAPVVVPLRAVVRVYQGAATVSSLSSSLSSSPSSFPGSVVVGRVRATDEDPYDRLRYSVVQDASRLFEVGRDDGWVAAIQPLDVGTYTVNISVSDGKFSTPMQGRVEVEPLSEEMLEEAVIVKFASVSPEEFVSSYLRPFVKVVRNVMKVRSRDVLVLGVQESEDAGKRRAKRQSSPVAKAKGKLSPGKEADKTGDLEVLFLVRKSPKGGDYYAREKVRRSLQREKLSDLASQVGLQVRGIQEDECLSGACGENGECQDTVVVVASGEGGGVEVISVSSDSGESFVAPRFRHAAACRCDEGFAGETCDVELNECARRPCPTFKECSPDSSAQGYSCRCPEGLTGQLCNVDVADCGEGRACRVVNPMTFGGKSYAQYELLRSVERHLTVGLGLRTLHATGNLLYAVGLVDYSVLEVVNGKLRFRFNFGSGEGAVVLDQVLVNDGEWHQVRLERHGNSARLTLDDGAYEAHGSAPGATDVLNLHSEGEGDSAPVEVYFGAEVVVHHTPTNGEDVDRGFVGCLDDIRIDDSPLPLHLHGESQVGRHIHLCDILKY